jgi:hypothetical protein
MKINKLFLIFFLFSILILSCNKTNNSTSSNGDDLQPPTPPIIEPTNPFSDYKVVGYNINPVARYTSVYIYNNYLYATLAGKGLEIYDITNQTNPVLIKTIYIRNSVSSPYNVFVHGNYAFVTDGDYGLHIIDVSTLSSAQIINTIETNGFAYCVIVKDNYAYVTTGERYLQVIDITDPLKASLIKTIDLIDTIHYSSTLATNLCIENNSLFIANEANILIFDISDPKNIYLKKQMEIYGISYISDIAIKDDIAIVCGLGTVVTIDITNLDNEMIFPLSSYYNNAHELFVKINGNYAYIAGSGLNSYGQTGIWILDISDPSSITVVKSISDYILGPEDIDVKSNYAYIAHNSSGLRIIDISNPISAKVVKTLDSSSSSYTEWVNIIDEFAYLATGYSGLKIADISDPLNAKIICTVETNGYAFEVIVKNNYAYVASQYSGLNIIDVSNPYNAKLVKSISDFEFHVFGEHSIFVEGNKVYVLDQNIIRVLDITDPPNAYIVKTISIPDTGGRIVGPTQSIIVREGYIYVSNGFFHIIDAESGSTIKSIDNLHSSYISCFKDNYLFITDSNSWWGMGGFYIYDISDPVNPIYITKSEALFPIWDIKISGNYLFLATSESGLTIFDVTDATLPYNFGSIGTPYAHGVAINNDYIYIADIYAGLLIIR